MSTLISPSIHSKWVQNLTLKQSKSREWQLTTTDTKVIACAEEKVVSLSVVYGQTLNFQCLSEF